MAICPQSARVEELSKPILDFESEMCTDVECSVLVLEFEEAMEGAMKARAAQLEEEAAARRAAAKAEEKRVKERAKAISDSATRVFDGRGVGGARQGGGGGAQEAGEGGCEGGRGGGGREGPGRGRGEARRRHEGGRQKQPPRPERRRVGSQRRQ